MNWRDRIDKNSSREKQVFIRAGIAALLILAADQLTKWYFFRNFIPGQSVEIIPGIFNFTFVRNLGAAWSIFSGYVWMLLAFGMAAAVAIVVFFRNLAEGCAERYYALLLILSGIAGNTFDRAYHGAVIDFIHLHYENIWHYPVFNVADMAICTGVAIYLLSGFLRKELPKEK